MYDNTHEKSLPPYTGCPSVTYRLMSSTLDIGLALGECAEVIRLSGDMVTPALRTLAANAQAHYAEVKGFPNRRTDGCWPHETSVALLHHDLWVKRHERLTRSAQVLCEGFEYECMAALGGCADMALERLRAKLAEASAIPTSNN